MDLYEALKAGTSPDELERKFQEELAAARKKYYNEEELDDTRDCLAEDITYYLSLILGKDFVKDFDKRDIVEFLKSMEKDLKSGYDVFKTVYSNVDKKTTTFNAKNKSDEEIINAFLKGLK